MAGLGSRFSDAGYAKPKPLIDVLGVPMIQAVVESLNIDANYIFIVQEEHYNAYNLEETLGKIVLDPKIVKINGLTDGAARTTLAAKSLIDNDIPLVIANSDQIVSWDSQEFLNKLKNQNVVALFNSDDPKWSYAKISNDVVTEVAEKIVISNNATVGIYGWKTGAEYVKSAEQMISKNIRTNNEFYICPVYNESILNGNFLVPYFVDSMHGVGTPEDLDNYVKIEEGVS
jgi:NDP-sugar pyrophosphorylase family protein